ncbi:alpha/beta fold hydrolase [Solimonas variicoloris]|uniref:alpha/beta fold hydrolase n=1 Tax=Solimonas variicoloris TaxID=254408 RepID=UPI0003644AFD|nr:alpha/beta fold hydrolase [Solimonas variicoloris]
MDGIEYRRVAANGLNFNVALAGEGPPVLLLHGFPDTHRVWQQQIGVLAAAGYRIIAPDQRGCGDSDLAPRVRDYCLEHLRDDMLGLLDALDVREPVRLVGHDWGAVVGWQLAIDAPQRWHSYVAMSVGHPAEYRRGIEQKLRGWYAFMFLVPGLAETLLPAGNWRALRSLSAADEAEARVAALSRPGRLTAGLRWYRANAWRVLTGRYGKTPLPVFGLWSDGDFALAESQMRDSQRQVTGPWRYARIEHASHWLQIDRADDINRLLLDWFAARSP